MKAKLLITAVVPLVLTIIFLSILSISNLFSNNKSGLQLYEKDMLTEKEQLIKNQILSINGVIQSLLQRYENTEDAKKEIIAILSQVRYLENKSGYFFAYEKKGDRYYFGFHGTKPQLNGKETNIITPDIKGFAFRKALIENAQKDKFVSYHYQKPNAEKILKKIAYSYYIKELNWTLVTGIYVDDVYKQIEQMEKYNNQNLVTVITETLLISVLVFVVTIALITYVLKKVFTQPLQKFEHGINTFFQYLNKQSNTIEHLDDSKEDELGIMSRLVNDNITKIKRSIDEDRMIIQSTLATLSKFEKGDLSQRVTLPSSNSSLKELTILLNKMGENLQNNIEGILKILNQYTDYNYREKVPSTGITKHLLDLANGVNLVGDTITAMLVENKRNGSVLDDSSTLLLNNVTILNTNSNEAASSLEETAAALEEVATTLSQSSENITQMRYHANDVTAFVNEGEQLAQKTTIAMDEINSQVNSINEAICVIDTISFQTNILSLNAAVEAAKAGESGKGFAVVAQEVRNLATRSAHAANDIKALVEKANNKANDGKKISNDMINGYKTLNTSIEKTVSLIKDVESSSKEQFSAIEQINNAVSILDRQTQQNASIASQTQEVANKTDSIAKLILSNANKKEFHGKNHSSNKSVI